MSESAREWAVRYRFFNSHDDVSDWRYHETGRDQREAREFYDNLLSRVPKWYESVELVSREPIPEWRVERSTS